MQLTKKSAIITGAASGLGREIALQMAQAGAQVGIADLALDKAEAVVEAVRAGGGTALALAMDVADEGQVESGVARAAQTFGGIDILVSNAGVQHIEAIVDLSLENWRRMMAIHLDGAFLTTRACLRHMYAQGRGGTVIYTGSVHSKEASVLKAPYVTAKHGLIGLCKLVAKEGAPHGVRANVICPGFVRTPLVEKQIPEQARDLGMSEEEVIKSVMLKDTVDGEFTTLDDVARTAVFLSAFPTNALTGQSIIVSHGWHMQ